jgi:hypothetical protein
MLSTFSTVSKLWNRGLDFRVFVNLQSVQWASQPENVLLTIYAERKFRYPFVDNEVGPRLCSTAEGSDAGIAGYSVQPQQTWVTALISASMERVPTARDLRYKVCKRLQ